MVVLDSDHSKRHVLAELEAYHELVSEDRTSLRRTAR